MSAALERLKQQTEQDEQQMQPDGQSRTAETLSSLLDAVEAQTRAIARIEKTQKELAGYIKTMDEQQTHQLEKTRQQMQQLSTSDGGERNGSESASVEKQFAEISATLLELTQAVDGERLSSAAQKLKSTARQSAKTMASASETLQQRAAGLQQTVTASQDAVGRLERRATKAIDTVADDAAQAASETAAGRLDAASDRAEKLHRSANRLGHGMVWSSVAAIGLSLLPLATVLLMVWVSVAAVLTGWQWVTAGDLEIWMTVLRGTAVVAASIAVVAGIWLTVKKARDALDRV